MKLDNKDYELIAFIWAKCLLASFIWAAVSTVYVLNYSAPTELNFWITFAPFTISLFAPLVIGILYFVFFYWDYPE